jgi:single-strand DNA-binding protein
MNVFTFTGNLGKDCRSGNQGGTAVCNFTVAVKSGYGDKEQTLWLDCALWGKQAESKLPQYLTKGAQVAVSGELGTREYEGKTYITCRVSSISLVGGKRDEAPAAPTKPATPRTAAPAPMDAYDDDIPFN